MSMPASPFATPLAQSAAAHHELMMTYVQAGFTRAEALQILLTVIAVSLRGDGR
jgi:hypothetical protein